MRQFRTVHIRDPVQALHCDDGAPLTWMYELNASTCNSSCPANVTYFPGASIVFSDTADLADFLNVTRVPQPSPGLPWRKDHLMLHAQQRLSSRYKTIIFETHVDGGVCESKRVKELVDISKIVHRKG